MSRMANELPIQPLDEIARRRIRSAVFHQLDRESPRLRTSDLRLRPRWRKRHTAAVVAVAAAAVFIVVFDRDGDRGESPIVASAQPSRVVTGDASSDISTGEASMTVAAQSALVVSGDDERGVLVVLERGSVACAVAPRKSRPPFRVQAGDVAVEVIGTRFTVERTGDTAEVAVREGTVKVSHRGVVSFVRAGEVWSQGEVTSRLAELDDAADRATDTGERARRRRSRRARGKSRHRDVRAADSAHRASSRPDDADGADGDDADDADDADGDDTDDADEDDADGDDADGAEPAETAMARYERAARMEAANPRQAIAIYRDLVDAGGPWAANALYAWGRLEHDRGDRATAVRLLRAYLRRYPDATNAAAARKLLGARP